MKNLLAKLLGISTALLTWFLPLFRAAVASGLEKLLPIALDIVTQLATGQLSGPEKQKAAVASLEKAAIAAGITASTSLCNFAVESAVQQLKATTK